MFTGNDKAVAHMNLLQAQDLHKVKSARIPAGIRQGLAKFHSYIGATGSCIFGKYQLGHSGTHL